MKTIISCILLLSSLAAFAHNEDQKGPNGGFIRMPGNFHTEVVPQKNGKIKVYLLDVNIQKPMVKDSSITASIVNGASKDIKCESQKDFFICETKKADLKKGTLQINAERNKVKGAIAIYELPLTLTKPAPAMKDEGHAGHH